jgi:serine/threonine protein kinase
MRDLYRRRLNQTRRRKRSLFSELLSKKKYPKKSLKSFVTKENADLATPDAIDFLEKLLIYDHQNRMTAKEAMNHPYITALSKMKSE